MFLGGCPCCGSKTCWKCYGKVYAPPLPDVGCGVSESGYNYKLPKSIGLKSHLTVGEIVNTPDGVDFDYNVRDVQAWVDSLDFRLLLHKEDGPRGKFTYRGRSGVDSICLPSSYVFGEDPIYKLPQLTDRIGADYLPCNDPTYESSVLRSSVNIEADCSSLFVPGRRGPYGTANSGLFFYSCGSPDQFMVIPPRLYGNRSFTLADTPDPQYFRVLYEGVEVIYFFQCSQNESRELTGYIEIEFQYETEDSTGRCCFSDSKREGCSTCEDLTKEECEKKKGLWTAGITCESKPCVIEQVECASEPPENQESNDSKWIPLGNKCHKTSEECQEDCGCWKCYELPQIKCGNCNDESEVLWPSSAQGALTYNSFKYEFGQEDNEAVQNFLDFFSGTDIPIESETVDYRQKSAAYIWRDPRDYLLFGTESALNIGVFVCKGETNFALPTEGGVVLRSPYFPPDGVLPDPDIYQTKYYGGIIGMDISNWPTPSFEPCFSGDSKALDINLFNAVNSVYIRYEYEYVPGGSILPIYKSVFGQYEITDCKYTFTFSLTKETEENEGEALEYKCFESDPPSLDGGEWQKIGISHKTEESCQAACPPTPLLDKPGGRTMPTTTTGPGTHLKNMLKAFGIKAKEKGCKCGHWQKKMDRLGNACTEPKNLQMIVDHLQAEAKKRRLPFVRKVGEMLVKRAVRKSQQNS